MRTRCAILASIVSGFLFSVFLLCFSIYALGTNQAVMETLMRKDAPAAITGLPESEYHGVTQMITQYLSGEADEFQYTFSGDDGTRFLCFTETEKLHMKDCQQLFVLDSQIAVCFFIGFLIFSLLGCLLQHSIWLRKTFFIGILIFIGMILCLCLWGVINFDSLFILFHRLSFRNDLWLMDPAKDLILRLMPTSFFIHYCLVILAFMTVILSCILIIFLILEKRNRRKLHVI